MNQPTHTAATRVTRARAGVLLASLLFASLWCGPLIAQKPGDKEKDQAKDKADKDAVTAADPTVLARAKALFKTYDRNQDGVVVKEEFPGSPEQFASADADRNGKLTEAEFLRSPLARRLERVEMAGDQPRDRFAPPPAAQALRERAWPRYDRDRDGRITRAEWTGSEAAFAALDANRDGAIERAEFAPAPAERKAVEPADADLPNVDLDWYEALKRFDKNGDKIIAREEAGEGRFARVFAIADRDKNGEVNEREFNLVRDAYERQRMAKERGSNKERRVYDVPFDAWDKTKDGKLDQDEWQGPRELFPLIDRDRNAVLSRLEVETFVREAEHDEFVGRYDQNGDGRVTREEFPGSAEAFRRADRNGDGSVNVQDR